MNQKNWERVYHERQDNFINERGKAVGTGDVSGAEEHLADCGDRQIRRAALQQDRTAECKGVYRDDLGQQASADTQAEEQNAFGAVIKVLQVKAAWSPQSQRTAKPTAY